MSNFVNSVLHDEYVISDSVVCYWCNITIRTIVEIAKSPGCQKSAKTRSRTANTHIDVIVSLNGGDGTRRQSLFKGASQVACQSRGAGLRRSTSLGLLLLALMWYPRQLVMLRPLWKL